MKEHGFYYHYSPLPGKKTPWDRAKRCGTSANAENIARGQRTAEQVVLAWWRSPVHHQNMLGRQQRIGIGYHEGHWTEMLGG